MKEGQLLPEKTIQRTPSPNGSSFFCCPRVSFVSLVSTFVTVSVVLSTLLRPCVHTLSTLLDRDFPFFLPRGYAPFPSAESTPVSSSFSQFRQNFRQKSLKAAVTALRRRKGCAAPDKAVVSSVFSADFSCNSGISCGFLLRLSAFSAAKRPLSSLFSLEICRKAAQNGRPPPPESAPYGSPRHASLPRPHQG